MQGGQTVRVATINVWSGLTYEGIWKMGEYDTREHRELRYQALVHSLEELDADVICLQEANPLPEYVRKLSRDLGYQAYAHVGMGGIRFGRFGIPTNFREGDAILVRPGYQVESLGKHQISGKGTASNYFTAHTEELSQIIGIRLIQDETPVNIFVTHLHAGPGPSREMIDSLQEMLIQGDITRGQMQEQLRHLEENEERRAMELQAAIEYISEKDGVGEPVIFAGDFNSIPGSESYQNLTSAGFEDTFQLQPAEKVFTWDAENNSNIKQYYSDPETTNNISEKIKIYDIWQSQRLDYVWVNAGNNLMEVLRTDLFGTEKFQGVHPSDHFGYMAEIRFVPVESGED